MDVLIRGKEKSSIVVCAKKIEDWAVAYAPIRWCFWKWDILLYDIIIVIRYRLNAISFGYKVSILVVVLHSLVLNISLFSLPLFSHILPSFLYLLSPPFAHFSLLFWLARCEGEALKKHCQLDWVSLLLLHSFWVKNVNVIIMIIRNVFLCLRFLSSRSYNNWMDAKLPFANLCRPGECVSQ